MLQQECSSRNTFFMPKQTITLKCDGQMDEKDGQMDRQREKWFLCVGLFMQETLKP